MHCKYSCKENSIHVPLLMPLCIYNKSSLSLSHIMVELTLTPLTVFITVGTMTDWFLYYILYVSSYIPGTYKLSFIIEVNKIVLKEAESSTCLIFYHYMHQ